MLKNREVYRETVRKGIDYITSQINPDGSMNPVEKGAFAYYKVPWALVLAGRCEEAERVIGRILKECMTEEGDLRTGKRQKFHLDYYTYENAWVCLAAHLLSLFDISAKTWKFISRFQDSNSGGYCSRKPFDRNGENLEDAMSTGWASNVGLHLGHLDAALRAADFIQMIWDIQPDIQNNFYYYWYPTRGLVLTRPEEEPEDRYFRINVKEPGNWYYILGAQIAFLSKLHLITQEAKHLQLAKRIHAFGMRCHQDIFQTDSAGKFCYASTHLYRASGEVMYLKAAERCADYLAGDQQPEGCWVRDGKATASSTAEFCVWLMNLLYCATHKRLAFFWESKR